MVYVMLNFSSLLLPLVVVMRSNFVVSASTANAWCASYAFDCNAARSVCLIFGRIAPASAFVRAEDLGVNDGTDDSVDGVVVDPAPAPPIDPVPPVGVVDMLFLFSL